MGRQREDPPFYSTLIESKSKSKTEYRTNIPKPVAEKMKTKSNSSWKVTFKFEENKIKLYWEPFDSLSDQ
jgi:hypothetical protein